METGRFSENIIFMGAKGCDRLTIPKLVFKYKSVNTTKELLHIIDILKNQRLYFPDRTKLNDPLEGKAIGISPGYAGSWRYSMYDEEDPVVESVLEKYRVLSLSEDGFSPQLWAHYGGVYSGVCFGYKTHASFSGVRPVQYTTELKDAVYDCTPASQYDEHFLYKHWGWGYEKEWRIIERTDDSYFSYKSEDLACVIVGSKMKSELLEMIHEYVPRNIPILKASPGYHSFSVKMEPLNQNHSYDGSVEGIIYSTEELLQYIKPA